MNTYTGKSNFAWRWVL